MHQFLMKYQLLYIFIILLIEFTYLIPNVDLKKKIIALKSLLYKKENYIQISINRFPYFYFLIKNNIWEI